MSLAHDETGRRIDATYKIISHDFERRLKQFDPRLKLVFDQGRDRWVILEQAYDNSGWNIIITAEDNDGNPQPLGEWVFNKLWVYRQRWAAKQRMGTDKWLDKLANEAKAQKDKMQADASDENRAMIRDDITQWRKAAREVAGDPASDAKAGYRKTTTKPKGE